MVVSNDKSGVSFQGTIDDSNTLVKKRMSLRLVKVGIISSQPNSRQRGGFLLKKKQVRPRVVT